MDSVSSISEFICISCWTSFEGESSEGEVVCPHCGYKQPSSNDYLASAESTEGSDQNQSPPAASLEPNVEVAPADTETQAKSDEATESEPDATTDEWSDSSASDANRPPGLEPISFDELDELETLLSSDDHDVPDTGNEPESSTPTEEADAADTTDDTESEENTEDACETTEVTTWRFKSDYGLTYSFFAVEGLLKWAEALGEQSQALVTNDGIVWKPFADFKKQVESQGDAGAAFQNTQVKVQEPAEAASPVETGQANRDGGATRPQRQTGPRRKGPAPRRKPSSAGARNTKGGSRVGQSKAGSRRGAAKGGGKTAAASGTAKAGFLVFGILLGGSAVYFGMYLLGFYDLVFKF